MLVCVYGINGAKGFAAGFWQLLVILSVMNLIDRFLINGYWVCLLYTSKTVTLYCYHIGQSYLKPMYAVVLIWFYVVMHTEGSFDCLLLGGLLPLSLIHI